MTKNGLGTYGVYTAPDGTTVNISEEAFNSIRSSGYDGELLKTPASVVDSDGLGTYGTYTAPDGTVVNVNEEAFNSIKSGGYDGKLKTPTSVTDFLSNVTGSNGLGTFGTYTSADGTSVNINKDAYNSIANSGTGGGTLKLNSTSFFGSDGFGMDDALGIGKLGVGLGNLYLANKQLGLAEKSYEFNKRMRQADYNANVTKYNNLYDFRKARNDQQGYKTPGHRIGE
jgi:hypothetical protein